MTADRYTKTVLTIIAICQCVIILRDLPIVKPAMAQSPMHVIVDKVDTYAFTYVTVPVNCKSGCK